MRSRACQLGATGAATRPTGRGTRWIAPTSCWVEPPKRMARYCWLFGAWFGLLLCRVIESPIGPLEVYCGTVDGTMGKSRGTLYGQAARWAGPATGPTQSLL